MERCPKCGQINADNRTVCFKCGTFLEDGWKDIVLRTWTGSGELRLKQHSLQVHWNGKDTEIPLKQIISVSILKEPKSKLSPGMIRIQVSGTSDTFLKLTSFLSVGNSNSIDFPHSMDYAEEAYKMKDYIINYQATPSDVQLSRANEKDKFEEIKKYKELLDMGIVTQDEFDIKKKQLLEI